MEPSNNKDASGSVGNRFGESTEKKVAAFLAAKSVLAGERTSRSAGDLKLLYFLLAKESGCDIVISEHEFRVQPGWLPNASRYFVGAASGVLSQILEWSKVTEPVGDFRRLSLGPLTAPHRIRGEWTAGARTIWLASMPDLISLSIRSGYHTTDELPPRILSGRERTQALIDKGREQMCPHCKIVAAECRLLQCGFLVCPSCGCSFTL